MRSKPYIDVFIKLIYPEMTELAMATLSEEDCIKNATKLIVKQAERIKELEAGLRNVLYESKSKAYSPKIVQSYAEQALKGGD